MKRIEKPKQQLKPQGGDGYKKCPVDGGWCINPFCALGCVEDDDCKEKSFDNNKKQKL